MNEVLFAVICAGAGLKKGPNGEECQENFEDSATRVVLVGRLYVASYNIGTWYLVEDGLCP
jgi:hypothetical protein